MSDFIAYVQELFADFGAVSARRMFGGYGLYREGVRIGVVMDDGLYLRADEANKARFETAGSAPFVYDSDGKRGRRPKRQWIRRRRCCRGRGWRQGGVAQAQNA